MRVSRAKRRLLRWERYLASTGSRPAGKWTAAFHRGHTKAYADVANAKRYAPIGLRSPYYARWMDR